MKDQNHKKQNNEKDDINPVAVAAIGVAIGAGVAIAAAGAVALKDKKNRQKVKEMLTNVKDQVVDYVEDVQKQAQDKKIEIEGELVKDTKKSK